MKKIKNLCIAIIALVGLSSSAFAQSTGTAPEVGATHTYTVNSVIPHVGSTYAWSVTTDYKGENIIPAGVANLANEGTNQLSVTWINPDLTRTEPYFVHVIETVTATTCSNHKVMAVTPVNAFEMFITSVDGITDADLTDYEACAPNVIVTGFTPAQDFTYDYGENEFFFKVTASGIGSNGWNPQFTIAGDDGDATYTAAWDIAIDGTYAESLNTGTTVNDIAVVGGNPSIWIKVTVANAEGTSLNPITVTLLDAAGTSQDINGNDVKEILAANELRVQKVKARPNTSGIATN